MPEYQPSSYDEGLYAAPPEPQRAPQPRTQPPPQQRQPSAPPSDLRGSIADQWPTQPPRAQGQPQADQRGYDLSAYGAPSLPGQYNDGPSLQAQRPSPVPQFGGQQPPSFQADRRGHVPQPEALDLDGYPSALPAGQQGRAVVAEQDYAHDDIEYEDEPPRRSRGLLIVGALVGAIGLGGGLAYGYKTFLGSAAPGKTPIVKADKSPAKTQPVDAGGKTFANQGVKVMGGRLTDGGTGDDDEGTYLGTYKIEISYREKKQDVEPKALTAEGKVECIAG